MSTEKLRPWKKLTKYEQRERMHRALNSGANSLREFVANLADECGVPKVEFAFWLLQQENYTTYEQREIEVRSIDRG